MGVEYPYEALAAENRNRDRHDLEYEIWDTGTLVAHVLSVTGGVKNSYTALQTFSPTTSTLQ